MPGDPRWHHRSEVRDLVQQYDFYLQEILRAKPRLSANLKPCKVCGIRFFTHSRNRGRNDLSCDFGCRQTLRRELSNARSRRYYSTASGRAKKKLLNERRRKPPAAAEIQPSEADLPAPSSVDIRPQGKPELPLPESAESQADRAARHEGGSPSSPARAHQPSGSPVDRTSITAESTPRLSMPSATGQHPGSPPAPRSVTLPSAEPKPSIPSVNLDPRIVWHVQIVVSVVEGRWVKREEIVEMLERRLRQLSIRGGSRIDYEVDHLHQRPP